MHPAAFKPCNAILSVHRQRIIAAAGDTASDVERGGASKINAPASWCRILVWRRSVRRALPHVGVRSLAVGRSVRLPRSSPTDARPNTSESSRTSTRDNEERFSIGGAAHRSFREGSVVGIRAGNRKTYWTKSLPVSPGLWALNVAGFCADAPTEYFWRSSARGGRRSGGTERGGRALDRSS
jgi:hypothetical protein